MRIPLRKNSPAMSKYEALSLRVSALALVVALCAAIVQPMVTYWWFDPGTKEYGERGYLVQTYATYSFEVSYPAPTAVGRTAASQPSRPASGAASKLKQSISDVAASPTRTVRSEWTLVNQGKRPLRSIVIHLGMPKELVQEDTLAVEGRTLTPIDGKGKTSAFAVSGAVAPEDQLKITHTGLDYVGINISTEHGDKLTLVRPESPPQQLPSLEEIRRLGR